MKHIFLFLFLASAISVDAQNVPNLNEISANVVNANSVSYPSSYSLPSNPLLNFQRTWIPNAPITDVSQINTTSLFANASQVTQYYDGLGRVIQEITRMNSNTSDLVKAFSYKPSNKNLSFPPYPVSYNSKFRTSPFAESKNYYSSLFPHEGNTAASETVYSSNANERSTTSYSPGKAFFEYNGVKTHDELNGANEVVHWAFNSNTYSFSYIVTGPNSLSYYSAATLLKKVTHDNATGAESIEYYNKDQQLVCSKKLTFGSCGNSSCPFYLTTYYLYDNVGRLILTMPPKATEQLTTLISSSYPGGPPAASSLSAIMEGLCSYRKYDEKGRVYAQHVPGEDGMEYTVFDRKNRPVLIQTPLLAQQGKYLFKLYDALDRETVTGTLTSTVSPGTFQTFCDDPAGTTINGLHVLPSDPTIIYYYVGFLNGEGTYPMSIASCDIHSYVYYDNYDQVTSASFDISQYGNYLLSTASNGVVLTPAATSQTNGFVTGTKRKVLKPAGSSLADWITESYFYDKYGHQIQTQATNAQGGTDIVSTQYNFSGQILREVENITNPLSTAKPNTTIAKSFVYSSTSGQLVSVSESLDNGSWKTLSSYTYDDLGKIAHKNIGSIEWQEYDYNIRGQLTGINGQYAETGYGNTPDITFGESIKYDYGFSHPAMNGNIAGIIWRGAGSSPAQAYGYTYDQLNQLNAADYNEYTTISSNTNPPFLSTYWNKVNADYSASNINYDPNGNILTMDQKAVANVAVNGVLQPQIVQMDQLQYNYQDNGISNKLQSVSDIAAATNQSYHLNDFIDNNTSDQDYDYDVNGNLTKDLNKGISTISYNFLNLPEQISTDNGGTIAYVYDASGNKVQETINDGTINTTYDYTGPLTYKNNNMQMAYHSEGRARYVTDINGNSDWVYDFFIKDHLGNVRTVMTAEQVPFKDYLATHELASANLENVLFDNIDEVRDGKPGSTDPSDLEAARLNGGEEDRRIGTALMLKVSPGDKFKISADAFYEEYTPETETTSAEDMANSIISTLVNGQGGFEGGAEGGDPGEIINTLFSPDNYINGYNELKEAATDPSKPRAFINYMLYDEDLQLVKDQSGVIQVGNANQWQTLDLSNQITVGRNGYLIVYISNESHKDVYFDQVSIKFWKGALLEEQNYYPHGLVINKTTTPPLVDKQNLYQTKEWNTSLGLNLYDFHARQYDPQLGRFTSIDPALQDYSPFTGMGNNPVFNIDPDGELFEGFLTTAVFEFFRNGFNGGFDFTKSPERRRQAWANYDPSRKGSVTNNALNIDVGWFRADKDKTVAGQAWQIITRLSFWEFAQQEVGNIAGHIENRSGNVKNVGGFHGATVLNLNSDRDYAYTIGSYIVGNFNSLSIQYDANNNLTLESSTLIHEYGHYLQSRAWGTFPLIRGAFNSAKKNKEIDGSAWSERDASLRGMLYFGGKGYSMQGYGRPDWPQDLSRSKVHLGWISAAIFTGIGAIIFF